MSKKGPGSLKRELKSPEYEAGYVAGYATGWRRQKWEKLHPQPEPRVRRVGKADQLTTKAAASMLREMREMPYFRRMHKDPRILEEFAELLVDGRSLAAVRKLVPERRQGELLRNLWKLGLIKKHGGRLYNIHAPTAGLKACREARWALLARWEVELQSLGIPWASLVGAALYWASKQPMQELMKEWMEVYHSVGGRVTPWVRDLPLEQWPWPLPQSHWESWLKARYKRKQAKYAKTRDEKRAREKAAKELK